MRLNVISGLIKNGVLQKKSGTYLVTDIGKTARTVQKSDVYGNVAAFRRSLSNFLLFREAVFDRLLCFLRGIHSRLHHAIKKKLPKSGVL
jgi:hypothetical protein